MANMDPWVHWPSLLVCRVVRRSRGQDGKAVGGLDGRAVGGLAVEGVGGREVGYRDGV